MAEEDFMINGLRRHMSSFTLTEDTGFEKISGEFDVADGSAGLNDENRSTFSNKDRIGGAELYSGLGVFGAASTGSGSVGLSRLKRCKSAYETPTWEHSSFGDSHGNNSNPWGETDELNDFLQAPSPEDTEREAKLSHQMLGLLESPRELKGVFDVGGEHGMSAATVGLDSPSKTKERRLLTRRATFSISSRNEQTESNMAAPESGGAPEWSGNEDSLESSPETNHKKEVINTEKVSEDPAGSGSSDEPGSPDPTGRKPMLRRVNSAALVRRAFPEMLFDRSSPGEESEHNMDLLAAAASSGMGEAPNSDQRGGATRQGASESIASSAESIMSSSSSSSPVPSMTTGDSTSSASSIDNNPAVASVDEMHQQQQQQQQQQLEYMMRMQQMQAAAAAAGAAPGGSQLGHDQSAAMQQQFMMYMQQQMMFMQQQAAQQMMGGANVMPPMPGMMNVNMNMNLNVPFPGQQQQQHMHFMQQQHGMGMGMGHGMNMQPPMGQYQHHGQEFHHPHQHHEQQPQGMGQNGFGRQVGSQRSSSPVPVHGGSRRSTPEPWQQQQQQPQQNAAGGSLVCSNLLAEHKHTGRKPTVAEIKTHVLEFSKDSHGSRFLQEAMNAATAEEKFALIEEVKNDCLSVIQDLFGNYVMQNFLDHATDEQRTFIAKKMRGVLVQLSMHPHGCRVVQKVLELLGPDQVRMELLNELIMTPGNLELTGKDAHATHVLQKAVVVLQRDVYPTLEKRVGRGERFKKKSGGSREPRRTLGSSSPELVEQSKVLLKAVEDVVAANVMTLAVNQHACRLVQRVLGDCDEQRSPCVSVMMKSLCGDYDKLARDQHGNFILQHILELGQQSQADAIQDHVSSRVVDLSQHKFGSHLVEKCLITSNPAQASLIIEALLATNPDKLTRMMKDPYANFVLQRAYDVGSSFHKAQIAHEVEQRAEVLSAVQPGRHILSHLSRAKQQQQH